MAFCGALRDEILDIEGLAAALMYELLANKPEMVEKYRAQGEDPEKTGYMMLENFSFSRKFVIRSNAADTGKGARSRFSASFARENGQDNA